MKYLTFQEILDLHAHLLRKYGGTVGVRDRGLLESAVHRPQAMVFGQEAYPSIFDKAAAICHSLILNHAFVDGNKRTAFAACHMTLLLNGWELTSDSSATYNFLIKLIQEHLECPELSVWLKKHSRKSNT